MTLVQMEARLKVLEDTVARLQAKLNGQDGPQLPWWVTEAGRFADDPDFEEMIRLGREYRESLNPDFRKKKKRPKTKASKHVDS